MDQLGSNLGQIAPDFGQLKCLSNELEPIWDQLGPTWADLGPTWDQLVSNFGQLEHKIVQLRPKMALSCAIFDQNGPRQTLKFIVFRKDFVCFRDDSLDAILGPTCDQLGPIVS